VTNVTKTCQLPLEYYVGDLRCTIQPPTGLLRSVCYVPGKLLNGGGHRVAILVVESRVVYHDESAVSFEIVDLAEGQGARRAFSSSFHEGIK